MRKEQRRLLCILTALLCLLALPGAAWAASVGDTFNDGKLSYLVSGESTVTVTGLLVKLDDGALVIPDKVTDENGVEYTVTAIGDEAFWIYDDANAQTIRTITFPETLTKIGSRAFFQNYNLSGTLKLPDNVTFIGNEAFCADSSEVNYLSNNITELILPAKLETVQSQAFRGFGKITSLEIPDSVENIGNEVFRGCAALENVTLPEHLTTIPKSMFRECISLQTITLPSNVSVIGDYAFLGCSSLSNINLADLNLTSIGRNSFSSCKGLSEITLPAGLKDCNTLAFTGCGTEDKSFTIKVFDIELYSKFKQAIDTSTIPSNFANTSVKLIDAAGNEVTVPDIQDGNYKYLIIDEEENLVQIIGLADNYNPNGKLEIPESVQKDGKSYKVTSIGGGVFNRCNEITGIVLPEGLTDIGSNAFAHCDKLVDVAWPSTLKNIEMQAFYECPIEKLDLSGTQVQQIGMSAFDSCNSLKEVILPETLLSIGNDLFEHCNNLEKVNIPASLQSMGTNVFSGCANLRDLTFGENFQLSEIPGRSFGGCIKLDNVVLPDSITAIGNSAFEGCNSLQNIELPNKLENVGITAFASCSSLKNITLPDSVRNIGTGLFWNCTSLDYVRVTGKELLNNIASNSFDGVPLVVCDDMDMYNYLNSIAGENTTVKFTCNIADVTINPNSILAQTYTGEEIKPAITLSYTANGETITFQAGEDYTLAYENNKELGTATITITPKGLGLTGGARTITFEIVAPEYNLVFEGNGGEGTMADLTVEMNRKYALPKCDFTAPAGKEFKVWQIDGVEYQPGAEYTVPFLTVGDTITVQAVWRDIPAVKYTVKYAAGGGSGTMADREYAAGDELTLPVCGFIAPEGKEFKAWQIGGTEYQPGAKYTVNDNLTITAIWQDKPENPPVDPEKPDKPPIEQDKYYTITFDTDGGYLVDMPNNSVQVKWGESYKMPGATKSGYTLRHWAIGSKESANQVKANDVYTFTADTTVYAVWQYNGGGGSGGGSRRPAQTPEQPKPEQPKPGTPEQPAATAANIHTVFPDLQPQAWYAEAIACVYNRGLMQGNTDGTFAPNEQISRAMFAQILYNLAGQPGAAFSVSFNDVAAEAWFAKAVNWAQGRGVVTGYTDEIFAPNEPITREQLAVMLWRFAGMPAAEGELSFTDSGAVGGWALEAVRWAAAEGIIIGNEDNSFRPQNWATRAEAAVMLTRYLERLAEN